MKTTRKVDKREQHVKKKLTAAILMLLISCIMTVTSTYAWFTLSTAPEVTGIQTTIGGNGNLEIALASDHTWTEKNSAYEYGEERQDNETDVNFSWGNLVGLDVTSGENNLYGLNKIVLYPAKLNVGTDGKANMVAPLSYPEYEADGRISQLSANTVSGTFDGSGFKTSGYGVRAIGATSSMTEREFAYRNAKNDITSKMGETVDAVNDAISNNGEVLGGIAVKYALNKTEYTSDEMAALKLLIEETESAVENVEGSIVNVIKGAISSKPGQAKLTDELFESLLPTINALTYTDLQKVYSTDAQPVLTSIKVTIGTEPIEFDDAFLLSLVTKYEYIKTQLGLASDATEIQATEGKYTWTQISTPLRYLMNTESANVKIGNESIVTLKALTKDEAVNKVVNIFLENSGSIPIYLGSGSSIYYDIAELVGSISGNFNMDIPDYGLKDVKVFVNAALPEGTTPYVKLAATGVEGLGAPEKGQATATTKIDDIYAFALDLFLRTNASNSNLLLQIDPAQRIYEDSTNTDTMGNGSTMKFTSTSMSEAEMVELLEHVKIMFISADDDSNGEILAEGRLDVRVTKNDAGEITAKNYIVESGAIIADIRLYGEVTTTTTNADNTTTTVTETKFIDGEANQKILAMNKGQSHKLTVLVYLDGESVTNADVSAFGTSMTGTMNLQFASDANLKAMDYSGLSYSGLETDSDGSDTGTNENTGNTESTATKLAAPIATQTGNTLTLSEVDGATGYEYKIGETTEWTSLSVGAMTIDVTGQAEGTVVSFRAVGEGVEAEIGTITLTSSN